MKPVLYASALVLLLSTNSFAAFIVQYDFDGQPGNQTSTAATFEAAGVSGAAFSRGAGLNATAGAESINSSSWGSAAGTPATDDEYFSFGFSAGDGKVVTLSSLQLNTRSSNTGPGTLGLYSSADGFVAALATIIQGGGTFVDSTIDLSSLAPIRSSSLEFRLIEIGNTQADGSGTTANGGTLRVLNFDDGTEIPVTLNGTVSTVPEPTSLALLGLVAGAFLVRRKISVRISFRSDTAE